MYTIDRIVRIDRVDRIDRIDRITVLSSWTHPPCGFGSISKGWGLRFQGFRIDFQGGGALDFKDFGWISRLWGLRF